MIGRLWIVALIATFTACGGVRGHEMQSTSDGLTIALHVTSTIVGEPQTVSITVLRDGQPVSDASTDLQWSMDGMPMEQRPYRMSETAPGTFIQRGFTFAMSGTWHALVTVREHQGESHSAKYTLAVTD